MSCVGDMPTFNRAGDSGIVGENGRGMPQILPRLSLETSLQAELHISQLPSEQLLHQDGVTNVSPAGPCSTGLYHSKCPFKCPEILIP